MFMRDRIPHRGVIFDARSFQQCSSPETAFRYKVAKQRKPLGRYRADQYLIYKRRSSLAQMDNMNHVSRAVPTPDQAHRVSLQTTSSRIGDFLEGPPPHTYFDHMPASTSATANITRSNGLLASGPNYFSPTTASTGATTRSTATWLENTGASTGESSIGQYTHQGEFTDGLYLGAPNTSGGHFDLGITGGSMPMSYLDSPSSSTYHMNSSSPNTMFGSFSSSIGPADHMDLDMSEFINNPAGGVSGDMAMGSYLSTHRHNVPSHPPVPMFPISPSPAIMESETVSPSMLRINNTPSLPVTSPSTESLPGRYGRFHVDTDSDAAQASVVPEDYILPSSGHQRRHGSGGPKKTQTGHSGSKWGRKQLPDKAPSNPQLILPSSGSKRRGQPDADSPPKTHPKRSKPKNTRASFQSQLRGYPSDFDSDTPDVRTGDSRALYSSTAAAVAAAAADSAADADALTAERSAKDDFLVKSRLNGMKYSEIRKLGNYKEAESTLRGRFRTLVKPKEARVRTPQWHEIDDKLLREAVLKLAKPGDKPSSSNIPWKAVADYISDNGGTYHFGNNTCHRRWNSLNEVSTGEVKSNKTKGKKDS